MRFVGLMTFIALLLIVVLKMVNIFIVIIIIGNIGTTVIYSIHVIILKISYALSNGKARPTDRFIVALQDLQ